jgi:hypothetical protein
MKVLTKRLVGSVVAVGVLSSIAVAGTAGMADAAAPVTNVQVYSWTGNTTTFKAPTEVHAYPPPVVTYSKITVSKNGVEVAKDVSSFKATPGTYQVTSTVKSVQTYDLVGNAKRWMHPTSVTNCHVTDVRVLTPQTGDAVVQYFQVCDVSAVFPDGKTVSGVSRGWTSGETLAPGQEPSLKVGDALPSGPQLWFTLYEDYTYPIVKVMPEQTTTATRTFVVTAVKNTPLMSVTERMALKTGDSLSRVRAIAGSKGTLLNRTGGEPGTTYYKFKNEDGKFSVVTIVKGKYVHVSQSNR